MLKIDISLLIQIVNFLFLVFVLNAVLYRPIRQIMEKRRNEMDALDKEVARFKGMCEEKDHAIEETIISARREGNKHKEELRKMASEEEGKILSEANQSVQERMQRAKEEIERSLEEAKKALDEQINIFTQELVQKILGRAA